MLWLLLVIPPVLALVLVLDFPPADEAPPAVFELPPALWIVVEVELQATTPKTAVREIEAVIE